MKDRRATVLAALIVFLFAILASAATLKCPPDSVKVGNVCIDRYEASVWQIDLSNADLLKKVQVGRAVVGDLVAAGATPLSKAGICTPGAGFPSNFPASGQWTPVIPGSNQPSPGVYALSIAGVTPTACITWFQAAQACRLAGKRLLTNLEWQDAAAGTPDPGSAPRSDDCNTVSGGASNTGSRTNCKSNWGVFDMIGNVDEWVADWVPGNNCKDAMTAFGFGGFDQVCPGFGASPGSSEYLGALLRGGHYIDGENAGVFNVLGFTSPSFSSNTFGFRCAR